MQNFIAKHKQQIKVANNQPDVFTKACKHIVKLYQSGQLSEGEVTMCIVQFCEVVE